MLSMVRMIPVSILELKIVNTGVGMGERTIFDDAGIASCPFPTGSAGVGQVLQNFNRLCCVDLHKYIGRPTFDGGSVRITKRHVRFG